MTPTAKYQQTQVQTASPMDLILMMYDECIQTLERAEKAFAIDSPERYQEINNQILHAEDIITELSVALDMEKGGEIANNLHRLYDFMLFHLSNANTNHVVKPVTDVRAMMQEMREVWQKVAENEPEREESEAFAGPQTGISVNI